LTPWESVFRPSKWASREVILFFKDSIFLLDTEPWFFMSTSIENLLCVMSEVSIRRLESLVVMIGPHECLTDHKNVISASKRILKHSHRLEDNF
jgi:hypothetical protein